MKASTPA